MGCSTEYNFCSNTGDTLEFRVRHRPEGGDYADVTGYSARMHIKKRITDENPVAVLACSVTDALKGEFTCVLSKDESADMVKGYRKHSRYVYSLVITSPGDVVTTLIKGSVVFNKGATV